MLVLSNIPLIISHWATHTHTHTRAGEAGRTRAQRPKNKLQLGYTTKDHLGSRKHKERLSPSSDWGGLNTRRSGRDSSELAERHLTFSLAQTAGEAPRLSLPAGSVRRGGHVKKSKKESHESSDPSC